MAEREACLVDVYDTLLSCDFVAHRAELPLLAGLSAQAWGARYSQLGPLADALVLSCEVGAEKPAAQIFTYALNQLGVPARHALFVDDQPAYCAGAAGLGITAVQIVRGELDGKVPAPGTTVVRSLSDVAAMF